MCEKDVLSLLNGTIQLFAWTLCGKSGPPQIWHQSTSRYSNPEPPQDKCRGLILCLTALFKEKRRRSVIIWCNFRQARRILDKKLTIITFCSKHMKMAASYTTQKGELKLMVPHHGDVCGSGSAASRILRHNIRWRWEVSFTIRTLYVKYLATRSSSFARNVTTAGLCSILLDNKFIHESLQLITWTKTVNSWNELV
jgi:hypothetical protein